ncbi:hypothetical protein [Arthrobacter sp. ISL-30]|uniref:hypothetical protein n=1 Tax=Arthrobacter sp. ISL-30 TaxID=2819109 RepID=UPI001BE940A7|nr:hypothetical protein [Arthrobacter sp. ISL-30]MBT2513721.1 hypothetical protein [Arthrobacter sp. ISL-30]
MKQRQIEIQVAAGDDQKSLVIEPIEIQLPVEIDRQAALDIDPVAINVPTSPTTKRLV